MKKLTSKQQNTLRMMCILALTKGTKFNLISPKGIYAIPSLHYLLKWVNKGTMSRLIANGILTKNYNIFIATIYTPQTNFIKNG